MESSSPVELEDFDDLNNVNLTSNLKAPDKPECIPILDLTFMNEEIDEIPENPPVILKQLPKKSNIAPRFIHYPDEEINNKEKIIQLKNIRFAKIKSKVKERVEKDQVIRKEKTLSKSKYLFNETKDLNIEKIMTFVKEDLKSLGTSSIHDLHEIKVKNRIKQSLLFLRKAKIQKSLISVSLIHSVLCESLRFIEAHIDACRKDCDRLTLVNTTDQFDRTALHYAAALGYEPAIYLLIQVGASPFAKDFKNRTPLHYSALSVNPKVIPLLLRASTEYKSITQKMNSNKNDYTIARLAKYRGQSLSVQKSSFIESRLILNPLMKECKA